ncbi:hypothetical protein [Desulfocurvus sp. DL9XJH121]
MPRPCLALSCLSRLASALFPAFLLLCLCLAGCAQKTVLYGYGPGASAGGGAQPEHDLATLPEGWGMVDVECAKGVGEKRGEMDTLFGCLLHAKQSGKGVVRLPKGVYLGHVAEFIVKALKFYRLESHFERFYGYRVVMVFRPATPEEAADSTDPGWSRLGAGVAGEAALTLFGAPLVPIVAPVAFAFESVDADMEFQNYKKYARANGLPEPTRRGDEITGEEYKRRYESYWRAVNGEKAVPGVESQYVVERCYLAHSRGGCLRLARRPGASAIR